MKSSFEVGVTDRTQNGNKATLAVQGFDDVV